MLTGPFANFVATVDTIDPEQRIWVLMNFMGQQTRMQVISNNLANVNTVGFKSDRVNFESLLYQISRSGGDQTSEDTALTSSLALGTGVRAVSTEKNSLRAV